MAPPYLYSGCFKVKVKSSRLKNSNLIDSIFVNGVVGIKALGKYYLGMETQVTIYIFELASIWLNYNVYTVIGYEINFNLFTFFGQWLDKL